MEITRHRPVLLALAVLLALPGCREADAPVGPGANGVPVFITSDPPGARIFIDDVEQTRTTPDTIRAQLGERELRLQFDTLGIRYEYLAVLRVQRQDSVQRLQIPLTVTCGVDPNLSCFSRPRRQHTAAGMRFTTSAIGTLLFFSGSGQGVFWPATSANSYASSGMPVLAGLANGEPVALGVYDQSRLAGRPVPQVTNAGGAFTLTQRTWVLPPVHPLVRPSTVRGIEIEEHVVARDDVNGVIVMRLIFRNISNRTDYRAIGTHLPPGPVNYTDTYIGFALDPDIGDAADDWLSYDPELDMSFAYDSRFTEALFQPDAAAPGVVGLRILQRPAGTNVVLNGWTNRQNLSGDWAAGAGGELSGYNMLTGRASYAPDHPHSAIGHLPTAEGDARITVTAGPLQLAPGQQAEIVIAFAIAPPAPGTFTPGMLMNPGDPLDTNRAAYRLTELLRQRMRAAETIPIS